MLILVIFEIEGMCTRQSLLETILWILLSGFLESFMDRLVYLWMQINLL